MKHSNLYTPTDVFANARNQAEVDNILNNDIYKFLMLDFILANPEYKDLEVKWKMKIRTGDIKTAEVIPEADLRAQLEATKNIAGVSPADISYLRGMNNPEGSPLFREATLEYLQNFSLPDYDIQIGEDGNYELEFTGPWASSMMWEIFGLKIMNSLYIEHYVKKSGLSEVEFNQIMIETINRLYNDADTLAQEPELQFSEFGTRRALSTDHQRMVYEILQEKLPNQLIGTSNVMLSREFGLNNPIGTNAHELRMIPTALHDDPEKIIETMYEIDRKWGEHHSGLSILLPDTYGSTFYFENCPEDIIQNHDGCRFDSKDPNIAIPEYVEFLETNNIDPQGKIGIPSDGLNAEKALDIFRKNKDKLGKLSFGIGTNLTNNTKGTFPKEELLGPFGSFSVVIKPCAVKRPSGEWVSTVKLSDNPEKAFGDKDRVELFKTIFGTKGQVLQQVEV